MPLVMEAHHKVLPDGPWLNAVKSKTGREDLFVYAHEKKGTFVICEWELPGFVATELVTISGPPDHFPDDLPTMEFMLNRCSRNIAQNMKFMERQKKDREYEETQKLLEEQSSRQEAAKMLRKIGDEQAAQQVENNKSEHAAAGSEEVKEMAESLNDIAHKKSYSITGMKPGKSRA